MLSINALAQESSTPKFNKDIEITATVEPGCFLEADDLSFGVLMTPITDQSTQGNIKIHCSKGANVNIQVSYDNQLSGGTSNYTYVDNRQTDQHEGFNIFIFKDGVRIGGIKCHKDGSFNHLTVNGLISKPSQEMVDLYGFNPNTTSGRFEDNVCLKGARLNETTFNEKANIYAQYGELIGVSKGEKIIFTLSNPKDNTVWTLNNNYETLSTGISQTIPMKANIKRSDNPTYRMTPDNYQSTLTVVLNY